MYYAVVVFEHPFDVTSFMMSARIGKFVHTDLVLVDDTRPSEALTFTSYIGSPFSVSISAKTKYSDGTHSALCICITEKEYMQMSSYAHDLCMQMVPYNYHDTTALAFPRTLCNLLMNDVRLDDAKSIKTLFCSQACVLVLRNGLYCNQGLYHVLKLTNSRTTSPCKLWDLMLPYSHRVSCGVLASGCVKPLSRCMRY